jgi:exonuclease VII large subunit
LIFTRAIKALDDWNDLQRKASRSVEISESYVDQGMSDFRANACRIMDEAGNRAASNLIGIVSRAGKLETIAEGRVGLLHTSILESGRSSASLAGSSVWNLLAKVNERSNGAIGSFQIKIDNDFASIKLAARRSIDGIDKHIDNSSMEVAANALTRTKRVADESTRFLGEVKKSVHRAISEVARVADENFRVAFFETRRATDSVTSGVDGFAGEISRSGLRMAGLADESSDLSMHDTASSMVRLLDDGKAETDRYLKDLKYFAMRRVDIAEQSFKDLMSGIVAMGVEPTLNRGFTIVYSEGKPVTTRKEAEKHHALEICFKDGRLNVTKSDK